MIETAKTGFPTQKRSLLKILTGRYPEYYRKIYRDVLYSINVFDTGRFLRKTATQALAISIATSALVAIVTYLKLRAIPASVGAAVATYLVTTYFAMHALLKFKIGLKRSEIAEQINSSMYNVLLTLHGLACAGVTPLEAIEYISRTTLNEAIKLELNKVLVAAKNTGKTMKQALLHVAGTTPSREFADLCRSLSGVLETTTEFKRLTENRLLIQHAKTETDLRNYLSNLETVSQLYLMTNFLFAVGAILFMLLEGSSANSALVYLAVIVGLPFLSVIVAARTNIGAPDKLFEKKLMKVAYAGVVGVVALVYVAVVCVLSGVNAVIPLVVATILLSIPLKSIMGRQINKEVGKDFELIRFLEKLVSLLDQKTLIEAIFTINPNDFKYLKDYVYSLQTRIRKGVPMYAVFTKLADEADTHLLYMLNTVFARVCTIADKIPEVANALMNQYAEYRNYKYRRQAISGTIVLVILASTVLVMFVTVMLYKMFLGTFTHLFHATPGTTAYVPAPVPLSALTPATISASKKVMELVITILPMSTAFAVALIKGDTRLFFKYYVILAVVAVACLLVITGAINLPLPVFHSSFNYNV